MSLFEEYKKAQNKQQVFEDEAVDISTIADSNRASGQVYNLQGLRVQSPQKGIYVQRGKKVLVTK